MQDITTCLVVSWFAGALQGFVADHEEVECLEVKTARNIVAGQTQLLQT